MILRLLNALLGVWLFILALAWPAWSGFHRKNALVVGVLAATVAVAGAQGLQGARYANAVLGAWLIVSVVASRWPGRPVFWNHLIIGFLLVLFGLAPRTRDLRRA